MSIVIKLLATLAVLWALVFAGVMWLLVRSHRGGVPLPRSVDVDRLVSEVQEQDPTDQSCVAYAPPFDEPSRATLRRNHLVMSGEERYELDLTFLSIVAPEEVAD